MYENTKVENSTISAVLSKFIMKRGSAAAEGLSVHTGNHMQLVGKFYRTVTNEDKISSGKVYDKDVVVEDQKATTEIKETIEPQETETVTPES